jgi:hypothetical protein
MPFVIAAIFFTHISLYFVGVRWVGHTGRTDINVLILLAEKIEGERPLGISGSR